MKIKNLFVVIIVLLIGFTSGAFISTAGNTDNIFVNTVVSYFSPDLRYKMDILRNAGETYSLKNLKPIVGPVELAKFINENDNNPDIYNPDDKNTKNGSYRANFHIHTVNSDGSMTVEEVLNQAQEYALQLPRGKYMYIAITDHNTVLGSQDIIKVLQNNPGKYSKLKIIPGIEIFTNYSNDIGNKDYIDIHVLTWCINPFDKFLVKVFEKKDLNDKWNWKERNFDEVIAFMKNYGIIGVAHPARYTLELNDDKYAYIDEMLNRYKNAGKSKNPLFIEGYYQNYPDLGYDHNKYIDYINQKAKEKNIIRTGSTDAHGFSIFDKKYNRKDEI